LPDLVNALVLNGLAVSFITGLALAIGLGVTSEKGQGLCVMIIEAASRFACAHRYIATATGNRNQWLFVCEGCAHRTELLPLNREASFGQLIAFPSSVGAELGERAPGRRPQSSLIQSA